MNLIEDRLRAALSDTAEQIPADAVPPLDLPAHDMRRVSARHFWAVGERSRWVAALAAAAAVCLIGSLSFALAGGSRPSTRIGPRAASYLAQFPPYYVALQQWPGCMACAQGSGADNVNPDRAVVLSTMSGGTVATVAVPKPFATFAFVQGTPDHRTFILGAQRLSEFGGAATKLYLLRLNPSGPTGKRALLSALPIPLLPTARGYELDWFAMSPNGHLLATICTTTATNTPTQLQVFDLVTGRSRTWILPIWAGRQDNYQDVAGPPTWAADSRTLAFFNRAPGGSAELVKLDTSAPAGSFSSESTSIALPRPSRGYEVTFGPDAPLLTPDGQHVIETVINLRAASHPPSGPLDAFGLDVVNLRTGVVTKLLQHSQMPFALASAPSGSGVIAAIGGLPGHAAGFVAATVLGTTAIQVPSDTIAVAW